MGLHEPCLRVILSAVSSTLGTNIAQNIPKCKLLDKNILQPPFE